MRHWIWDWCLQGVVSVMPPLINIAGRPIGPECPPYIIAELSANHNGSLNSALSIIDKAAEAGATAVKLQTYRADTITLNSDRAEFKITEGKWAGQTLYELYESAFTPWDWHKELFDRANAVGVTMFSSPFDQSAVDFLEDLNAPAYKIASFEAVDIPLIRYVAGTGKPMIISTGMADAEEIAEAIETARDAGCKELAILHCVSGYPAPPSDYNLRLIPDMMERFKLVTGLSDHTLDNTTAIAAVALGSSIIEKHVTLNRNGGGPDDSFSLEPQELNQLCVSAKIAWKSIGTVDYGPKASERANIMFRRSLYFVKSLKAGELITSDCLRSIRPGFGAAPKHFDKIIGKRVLVDIKAETPVSLADIAI